MPKLTPGENYEAEHDISTPEGLQARTDMIATIIERLASIPADKIEAIVVSVLEQSPKPDDPEGKCSHQMLGGHPLVIKQLLKQAMNSVMEKSKDLMPSLDEILGDAGEGTMIGAIALDPDDENAAELLSLLKKMSESQTTKPKGTMH